MSHMVIYRTVDGKPGFHQTDDLVAAVEFVERLRNVEGVENARIYRLEQVNFRFQPYYQVHLDAGDGPTAPALVVTPPETAPVAPVPTPATGPVAPAATVEPAPVPPPVLSAAMAAAAAEPAAPAPTFEPAEGGAVPSLGATPTAETADSSGIRRGLFGR